MRLFQNDRSDRGGFTMIEVLVVLGIIAILAAVTFGLVSGVTERGRTSRAQTELRMIAQGLEQYRNHYGDYPWVGLINPPPGIGSDENQKILFNALAGVIGPRGAEVFTATGFGRSFVEHGRLTMEFDEARIERENLTYAEHLPDRDNPGVLDNRILDPWGNPYRYFYRNEGAPDDWERTAFVLYSMGPSGADDPPDNSGYMEDPPDNRDNLYYDD